MLTLCEELLLLAVHDEKGNVVLGASSSLPYGLASAVLLDLEKHKKIEFENDEVKLLEYTPTGYDFLDKILIQIKGKTKNKFINFWIKSIGLNSKELINDIFEQLTRSGILLKEEQKMLWTIKFERYPTLNPVPELETRDRIHKSVLMGLTPDASLLDLMSLLYYCNLINEVFPKGKRREARSNLAAMIHDHRLGIITHDVIKDMTGAGSLTNKK